MHSLLHGAPLCLAQLGVASEISLVQSRVSCTSRGYAWWCAKLVRSLLCHYGAPRRQPKLGVTSEISSAQSRGSHPGRAFIRLPLPAARHVAAGRGIRDRTGTSALSEATSRPSKFACHSRLHSRALCCVPGARDCDEPSGRRKQKTITMEQKAAI